MMGASGKGRARRGAQAERAVPDLAEADLTTRSADRLARRQHVNKLGVRKVHHSSGTPCDTSRALAVFVCGASGLSAASVACAAWGLPWQPLRLGLLARLDPHLEQHRPHAAAVFVVELSVCPVHVGPGLVLVSIYARLRGTAVYDRTNPITVLGVGNLVSGLVYCVGRHSLLGSNALNVISDWC